MTDTPTLTRTVDAPAVDRRRLLLTPIPGPESLARQARRGAAVPQCVGTVLPVCGTYGNVGRMLPPLVISDHLLEDALSIFADTSRSLS